MATALQIQQLYVAYFGRPADPAGLDYWVSTGISTKDFAAAMYAQPEFQQVNANLPVIDQVNALYLNLFGRNGDTEGLLYWTQQINTGKLTLASIANDLIFAANNNPSVQSQLDKTALNNKTATAIAYTGDVRETSASLIAYNATSTTPWVTGPQFTSAVTYLATVTQTAPTAAAIQASVDAMTAISPAGQTFTLTTNADTATATNFVGVASDNGATFQVFDTLTGTSATTDTLTLTLSGLAANSVPVATVTGVENINVRNASGNAQTIALNNFVGATNITSNRSINAMTVTGMTAGQSLTIQGDGSTINSTMANTYANSVTSATMNLVGGVTGGAITQTAAGLTTQIINSTLAANTVGAIALSGAATVTSLTINAATALTTGNITNFGGTAASITISGAATNSTTNLNTASVNLGVIENATVKTINASGLTAGGVNFAMSSNTGLVVTGGNGNDIIATGAALSSSGSANAGAGTADRLILSADANINTTAIGARYSNFEVVELTAGRTFDMDNLAANNTINGLRLAGSATVTNINAATASNITILANSTPSLGIKNATDVGQIDTVNITVSDEATAVAVITLTTPVLTGVEKLNLIATDSTTITAMTSAASVDALTITGAGNTNITTGAVATVLNSAVNASAGTGTFTYTAAATTGVNGQAITGSATKVNNIVGTANADIILGGSAADAITNVTTGVTASAGDVITGGAGFDTFTLHGSIASAALTASANTTTRIVDFVVGTSTTTTDFLSLSATFGNYSTAVAFTSQVAAAAAGATVVQSVQQSNGAAAIAGADMLKLTTGVAVVNGTTTLAEAFNSAIGTSTITGLDASTSIYFSMYDTTNSRMILGIANSTAGVNTTVQTGDTVVLVGTLNMTAADYANFGNSSLAIVA